MLRALAFALLFAAPAQGDTIVLDFEEEIPGFRHNFFSSAECGGCVAFWHSDDPQVDWDLQVDKTPLTENQVLVSSENGDHGGLHMAFASPLRALPKKEKERVAVCHKGRTHFVSGSTLGGSALRAHLAHGDSEGACPSAPEPNNERVAVCHKGRSTLFVDASALSGHLAHGDAEGACPGP